MRKKKWICLNCLREYDANPIYEHEEYTIKGKKIVITALKAKCPCCGEYMENDEVTDINLQAATATYRQEEKLLSPDEIKKIRKKYGCTQVSFSRILGFGDKTIARYENGYIQDAAPNNLILLMNDRNNFIKLWQQNKDKIEPKDNKAIEETLGYKTVTIRAFSESRPFSLHFDFFSSEQHHLTTGGSVCQA